MIWAILINFTQVGQNITWPRIFDTALIEVRKFFLFSFPDMKKVIQIITIVSIVFVTALLFFQWLRWDNIGY